MLILRVLSIDLFKNEKKKANTCDFLKLSELAKQKTKPMLCPNHVDTVI